MLQCNSVLDIVRVGLTIHCRDQKFKSGLLNFVANEVIVMKTGCKFDMMPTFQEMMVPRMYDFERCRRETFTGAECCRALGLRHLVYRMSCINLFLPLISVFPPLLAPPVFPCMLPPSCSYDVSNFVTV